MKRSFFVLLVGGLFALVYGCRMAGAPITELGTPEFVPASQPDSIAETGIGQDPKTGGIQLQWYTTTGAASYRIYRSDSLDPKGVPTGFKIVGNVISSASLNDTSMVDANSLRVGVRHYYYLTAHASDGSSSPPSDTIDYALLDRPGLSYPGVNAAVHEDELYFNWHDNTGGGYTVIRVRDISLVPSVTIWVSRRFQIFDTSPRKAFNFDGAAIGQLVSGHSYQWRVDRFNLGVNEGARSTWQVFTIQ
ncbi:MAG: hypothetical protein M1378_05820 [Bacteroidetes bacterium]|jgi:hypothetical protein|nr:hypothetical protein [Bacteroidota bacterium]MCL5035402.1 hypothetical protein [Bacteroidota bacterium]